MKIIFIVGLPCSGKTYLGKDLIKNGGRFIDDLSKQGLPTLDNVSENILVISDPYLCRQKDRNLAQQYVKKKFPNCTIEWIFFENAPTKCLNNMQRRMSEGDNRLVRGLIVSLSKEYVPQGNILLVWEPVTTKLER